LRSGTEFGIRFITIEMILNSVKTVVGSCTALGLDCRGTPVASARLLRSLGYNVYQVKRFWEEIESLDRSRVPIFRSSVAEFDVRFLVNEGPLYEIVFKGKIVPVDEADLKKIGNYIFAPRARKLYLRLIGKAEGYIDINLVRVLSLAEKRMPGITSRLSDSIEAYIRKGSSKYINNVLVDIIKNFRGLLRLIIPEFPKDVISLKSLIPFLRRVEKS
jgi:hypothetical protein